MMKDPRRGVCPGLSEPMATGDGLLVRLVPAAPVPLTAMAGLCEAARRHGNGTIEVTARGSLQVRGLAPDSAPLFAGAVADLGIAFQEGVPVIAAIDDGAADLVAAELRRAIAEARLAPSPKFSVVVDGDGPLHLDGLSADVRLRLAESAQGTQPSGPGFYLGIGSCRRGQGTAPARGDGPPTTWLGMVTARDAARAVTSVLAIIAARGPAARAADILDREGIAAFHATPALDPALSPPARAPAEMIGVHAMRDGTIMLGVGLGFGHTHSDVLRQLIRLAARSGARAVRPAPDRVLLLTGVAGPNARDLIAAAERLGFVVRADDPRRRIAACPGAPACASGMIPARTLASALVPALASVLKPDRNGVVVHISGCPKGCAHPLPAALTVVGTPQGCGVIRGGSACEAPRDYVDPFFIADEILRVAANPTEAAHG